MKLSGFYDNQECGESDKNDWGKQIGQEGANNLGMIAPSFMIVKRWLHCKSTAYLESRRQGGSERQQTILPYRKGLIGVSSMGGEADLERMRLEKHEREYYGVIERGRDMKKVCSELERKRRRSRRVFVCVKGEGVGGVE